MFRRLVTYRALIALLTAALWAFGAVAGPAHAAEEDIHHAVQHQDDGDASAAQGDDSPRQERSVHPEHANHCHSGGCHFHMMARGAAAPAAVVLALSKRTPANDDHIRQNEPTGLFHPPRV